MATRDPYAGGTAPGASASSQYDAQADTTPGMVDRAREKVGHGAELAREQVKTQITHKLGEAAQSLDSLSEAVVSVGAQLRRREQAGLANYAEQAAGQVDRLAHYLRESDVDRIVNQVEQFARRQPALFLGSTFTLGLLGSRFLRASGQPESVQGSPLRTATAEQLPYDAPTAPAPSAYPGGMADETTLDATPMYARTIPTGTPPAPTTGSAPTTPVTGTPPTTPTTGTAPATPSATPPRTRRSGTTGDPALRPDDPNRPGRE